MKLQEIKDFVKAVVLLKKNLLKKTNLKKLFSLRFQAAAGQPSQAAPFEQVKKPLHMKQTQSERNNRWEGEIPNNRRNQHQTLVGRVVSDKWIKQSLFVVELGMTHPVYMMTSSLF